MSANEDTCEFSRGGIFSGEFSRAKFTKLFDTKEFPPRMTRWDPKGLRRSQEMSGVSFCSVDVLDLCTSCPGVSNPNPTFRRWLVHATMAKSFHV